MKLHRVTILSRIIAAICVSCAWEATLFGQNASTLYAAKADDTVVLSPFEVSAKQTGRSNRPRRHRAAGCESMCSMRRRASRLSRAS
jgi:hypothetical protein